jgi:hypothetical protein
MPARLSWPKAPIRPIAQSRLRHPAQVEHDLQQLFACQEGEGMLQWQWQQGEEQADVVVRMSRGHAGNLADAARMWAGRSYRRVDELDDRMVKMAQGVPRSGLRRC